MLLPIVIDTPRDEACICDLSGHSSYLQDILFPIFILHVQGDVGRPDGCCLCSISILSGVSPSPLRLPPALWNFSVDLGSFLIFPSRRFPPPPPSGRYLVFLAPQFLNRLDSLRDSVCSRTQPQFPCTTSDMGEAPYVLLCVTNPTNHAPQSVHDVYFQKTTLNPAVLHLDILMTSWHVS